VRHEERGTALGFLQVFELDAQRFAELGVEVGKRLVHEKEARFANDCPADGDALHLSP
jgi:hypothetical protein